jgi:putative ABC transport system substrate-binding protein
MRKLVYGFIAIFPIFLLAIDLQNSAAKELGVAWEGKSGMANRVTQGFEKGMKEFAPDIKIEFQKDLASIDKVAEFAAKWQKEKDGMVILRSSGAKWLGKNPPTIPAFIGGCNHPGELGAVKNLQAPEGNITGVTYFLPVDTQFEIFQAILPKIESLLLLLENGHPGSVIDQEGTRAICKKLGIQYNEILCSSPEDTVKASLQFKGKVTAMIIGNQALIIDNTAKIVEAAGKTPVLAYSSDPVKVGALGGFVADDVKLGYLLAQSVRDVLIKGKAVKEVPVKVDPEPKFSINVKTAQKLAIEIPYIILQSATLVE